MDYLIESDNFRVDEDGRLYTRDRSGEEWISQGPIERCWLPDQLGHLEREFDATLDQWRDWHDNPIVTYSAV